MMRKLPTTSAYSRRIQTSRREIAIAITLTLAALVLTLAALWSGTDAVDQNPVPQAPASRNS